MKSIDDQKNALRATVASLEATVETVQAVRDDAARDLARTEDMLAAMGSKVDLLLQQAIYAAQVEGLVKPDAMPTVGEEDESDDDVDDVALAQLCSSLSDANPTVARLDDFVDIADVMKVQEELQSVLDGSETTPTASGAGGDTHIAFHPHAIAGVRTCTLPPSPSVAVRLPHVVKLLHRVRQLRVFELCRLSPLWAARRRRTLL
jgi:hypothetical protein